MSNLLPRLDAHIRQMAPHVAVRDAGQLLTESRATIASLTARAEEAEACLRAKLDDMLGSFNGYSWDSGAGSSGYDEAVKELLNWLDDRDAARKEAQA